MILEITIIALSILCICFGMFISLLLYVFSRRNPNYIDNIASKMEKKLSLKKTYIIGDEDVNKFPEDKEVRIN